MVCLQPAGVAEFSCFPACDGDRDAICPSVVCPPLEAGGDEYFCPCETCEVALQTLEDGGLGDAGPETDAGDDAGAD